MKKLKLFFKGIRERDVILLNKIHSYLSFSYSCLVFFILVLVIIDFCSDDFFKFNNIFIGITFFLFWGLIIFRLILENIVLNKVKNKLITIIQKNGYIVVKNKYPLIIFKKFKSNFNLDLKNKDYLIVSSRLESKITFSFKGYYKIIIEKDEKEFVFNNMLEAEAGIENILNNVTEG